MEGEEEHVPRHTPWQNGQVADTVDKLWYCHEKSDSVGVEIDYVHEGLDYTQPPSGAESHF